MPTSTYLRKLRAAESFGGVAYTPPPIYYLGFLSAVPYEWPNYEPEAAEITGTGYARLAVPNDAENWTAPDDDARVTNQKHLKWGKVGADDWEQPVALGIWDAPTGGNLLYYESLYLQIGLLTDVVPYIKAGDLSYREY